MLSGAEVERPPMSLWYHFGVQHGSGEKFAEVALEYFHHYDLDFLKVMNDYYYPPPAGLDAVRNQEDLKRIERFDVEKCEWREQFRALEVIAGRLKGKAYFLDTVFDPWQTIRRSMAGENLKGLMENEPQALLAALEIVTENLTAYCKRSLERGAAGIFLSIPAASEIVSRDHFLRFVKPFSAKLLKAVFDLGKMNTAHIHGEDLFFEEILDLPVQVLSWWDRGPKGPTLPSVKARFKGCVMGGIDQTMGTKCTMASLRDHVREGLALGGRDRFFLANGCSIDTWIHPGHIRAMVSAARGGV